MYPLEKCFLGDACASPCYPSNLPTLRKRPNFTSNSHTFRHHPQTTHPSTLSHDYTSPLPSTTQYTSRAHANSYRTGCVMFFHHQHCSPSPPPLVPLSSHQADETAHQCRTEPLAHIVVPKLKRKLSILNIARAANTIYKQTVT